MTRSVASAAGIAAVVVLVACGSDQAGEADGGPDTVPLATESATSVVLSVPSVSTSAAGESSGVTSIGRDVADAAVDGPVLRHPQRSERDEGLAAEIRGELQVEGECLYVAPGEGDRYPILWPAGTAWHHQSRSVISPTGTSIPVGTTIAGGGGYLYVVDVERLAGEWAALAAERCVDNTYGEIAVVNNAPTAIGPTAGVDAPAPDLSTTPSSRVRSADSESTLADALETVDAAVETAPGAVVAAFGDPLCGTLLADEPSSSDDAAIRCLLDADRDSRPAAAVVVVYTTEGDPLVEVWLSGPTGTHVATDSSRDSFGTPGWSTQECGAVGAAASYDTWTSPLRCS